jgi:hypothetical protein
MREIGIEEEAIKHTARRFAEVTSGRHQRVSQLPAFFRERPGQSIPTLRQAIWPGHRFA